MHTQELPTLTNFSHSLLLQQHSEFNGVLCLLECKILQEVPEHYLLPNEVIPHSLDVAVGTNIQICNLLVALLELLL